MPSAPLGLLAGAGRMHLHQRWHDCTISELEQYLGKEAWLVIGTFAILLEKVDLSAVGEMVTEICEAISAREMKVRESDEPMGRILLSAGVAASRSRSAQELVEAAQAQLRRAKQPSAGPVAVESRVIGMSATS